MKIIEKEEERKEFEITKETIDKLNDMMTTSLKKGGWIQKAINPKHKNFCTPMSKKTCTGHRRALAKRFKSGDLS